MQRKEQKPLRGVVVALLLLFALLALTASSLAQQPARPYQLRAVMLFRFAQFVDWPPQSFGSTNSPIVIGVLGEDPFGETLRAAVKGETAHGRPIEVRRLRRRDQAADCHILYVSQSEAGHLSEIMAQVAGKSVLTVSDIDDFVVQYGGIIRFTTEQNRIGLRINPDAAREAHLTIDSRLLRLAQIVSSR